MTAPTGLHGWIQSNDGRSTGLFVGFLLAIQLVAPLALVVPLIVFDPAHAPFGAWGGYLLRYAPLVLLASVLLFAAQLWWHVETVKRAVGFDFVDAGDEPRLCAVIEPLIILAGLPVPFVGVVESEARNAFACGIGRNKAVVVVTRGLLDALSDAELTAVLAHELSHIRNGDIRLMAAANIFMTTLAALHARNVLRFTPVHGLAALAVPALLPLSLAASVIGRLGLRAGQVSRLLIASSREFIADAQAAEWTRDPAALAAALLKVDGRHRIVGVRAEDDAMMIAGDSEGTGATHPTVAQRVAALARVTGSMVWNAPASPRDQDWTATTPRRAVEQVSFGRGSLATDAIARVRQGDDQNLLGLTLGGTVALVLTVGAFVGLHWGESPSRIAARLDPRPLLAGPSRSGSGLLREIAPGRMTRAARSVDADRRTRHVYRGQSGRMTPTMVIRDADGLYVHADGSVTHALPIELAIAETDRLGCFVREPRPIESIGRRPLEGQDAADDLRRITSDLDRLAIDTTSASAGPAAAAYYVERRENLVDEAYAVYGQPGLDAVRPTLADAGQAMAVERLRGAARDPAVLRGLTPVQRAKLRALLRDPAGFVPCRSLASPRRR